MTTHSNEKKTRAKRQARLFQGSALVTSLSDCYYISLLLSKLYHYHIHFDIPIPIFSTGIVCSITLFWFNMQIPPSFAKFFYGTPRPQKIKLQNSGRSFWQVNVVKIDNKLFFKKGWGAFVKDNLLELKDFVVFNYVGRSIFRLTIFGRNACEKDVTAVPRKSDKFVSGKGRKKKEENNDEQRTG
ncbi:B3 domain-containing protein At1g16640-like [Durio zibethinus]|uniref:B3 domain-containing protein At1g16640-like n=1 Tax=Durio zibethinus TaxID=66656 RepID=A0A6P6BAM1_DURZI|nr:B3 domain-containing protein At1g16640-like [Durio zibethinus]